MYKLIICYSQIAFDNFLSLSLSLPFSFYTQSGTGYEAFFTENMNFVVATATKREFHAYIVYKAMFRSSEWVSY